MRPSRVLALLLCGAPLLAAAPPPDRGEEAQVRKKPSAEELRAQVREILERVSKIRGLPIKRQVAVEIAGKDKILEYLEQQMEAHGEGERMKKEGRLFARLGLVPDAEKYTELVKDVLVAQIAGYYDPERDTFIVADWIAPELQGPVMSHELTHALQDQNFSLDSYLEPIVGNSDKQLARSALVEGDGMLTMMMDLAGEDMAKSTDMVALAQMSSTMGGDMGFPKGTPPAIVDFLIFPYAFGATFLQHALDGHDWKYADRAYKDLPDSTEQILQPEKYWDHRDEPQKVEVAPVARAMNLGQASYADVLGQYVFYVWLKQTLPVPEAVEASRGWDGDQYALYGEPGKETLVMFSEWDSLKDAGEAAEGIVKALGGTDVESAFASGNGPAWVHLKGTAVTFVLGPSGMAPEELALRVPRGEAPRAGK
ncbi:MAG: hypothetical protein U0167_00330 [bacterium]